MAKSLFRAVILVAVFAIVTRVLGFLFRIYLSRKLGANLLGVYQIASSVFMVLVLLVASGIPLTISKKSARFFVLKNENMAHKTVTAGLLFGVTVSLIICLVFFLFKDYISKIFADSSCMTDLLILLPAIVFSAIYSSLRGYLWGRQDYFFMGLGELIEQVVRIVVFILFANLFLVNMSGANVAALSLTVACFVSMIFIIIVYHKKGGRIKNPRGNIKGVIKSSLPITGVRAASSLIQPIIALLFPVMLSLSGVDKTSAVSVYGVIMGMTFPLLFLPSTVIGSLSFALIPELSKAQEQKKLGLVEERIKSSMRFSIIASSLIVPLYVGIGIPICSLLFDNALSGEFLRWAAIIMIPMGLSNVSSSILNSLNLEVKSFVNNLIGGFFLILCVVCFSGVLGAYALIVGFFLCMFSTSFLNIMMIKKKTKISLHLFKTLILCLLFSFIVAILSNYLYGVLLYAFPSLVCLIVSATVSLVCFLVLLWAFGICDIAFIFSKVKNVIKFSKKRA